MIENIGNNIQLLFFKEKNELHQTKEIPRPKNYNQLQNEIKKSLNNNDYFIYYRNPSDKNSIIKLNDSNFKSNIEQFIIKKKNLSESKQIRDDLNSEDLDNLESDCLCGICYELPDDIPYHCSKCNYIICKNCFAKKKYVECPKCRRTETFENFVEYDNYKKNLVKKYQENINKKLISICQEEEKKRKKNICLIITNIIINIANNLLNCLLSLISQLSKNINLLFILTVFVSFVIIILFIITFNYDSKTNLSNISIENKIKIIKDYILIESLENKTYIGVKNISKEYIKDYITKLSNEYQTISNVLNQQTIVNLNLLDNVKNLETQNKNLNEITCTKFTINDEEHNQVMSKIETQNSLINELKSISYETINKLKNLRSILNNQIDLVEAVRKRNVKSVNNINDILQKLKKLEKKAEIN